MCNRPCGHGSEQPFGSRFHVQQTSFPFGKALMKVAGGFEPRGEAAGTSWTLFPKGVWVPAAEGAAAAAPREEAPLGDGTVCGGARSSTSVIHIGSLSFVTTAMAWPMEHPLPR